MSKQCSNVNRQQRQDVRKLLENDQLEGALSAFSAFNKESYNYSNRTDGWKSEQLKLQSGALKRDPYVIPYDVRGSYGRVRLKRETYLAIDLPGGPGSALTQQWRSNANPELYRVATANWRGVGDTTPFSSLMDNNTANLIEDINALRLEASQGRDEPVVIRGASWGMSMAVLYAAAYPEKVAGLVLGLPFLAGQADIDHNYARNGVLARRYPAAFEAFSEALSGKEGREATQMLSDELGNANPVRVRKALLAALKWEYARNGEVCPLTEEQVDPAQPEIRQLVARARVLNHYTTQGFFLPEDGIVSAFKKVSRNTPVIVFANSGDPLGTADTLAKVQEGMPQAEINVYDANWHWVAKENERADIGFDNSFVTQGYPYAMGRMALLLDGKLRGQSGMVKYARPNMEMK